jgi:hypothetical protein
MAEQVLFDIYGRFEVTAELALDGTWLLYVPGSEGKHRHLTDVILPDDATLDDVERGLEATFHELGTPGSSISRIER